MKILVCADQNVSMKMIGVAQIVLDIDKDKKGFIVNKHRNLPITGDHRHISELKHILLAEEKAIIKDLADQVDGYHGIEGGWPKK